MNRPTHLAIPIALGVALATAAMAGNGVALRQQGAQDGSEPASVAAVCGNGLVEPGENCNSCEMDCKPLACAADGPTYSVEISLATHPAWDPTAATIHLSYRTNRLTIPGQGDTAAVRNRVEFGTSDSGITAVNDLDHSIRIVRAESKPLPRPLATIELDGCGEAPDPTIEDLSCVVEGCAGLGGVIEDGCVCELHLTKRVRPSKTTAHRNGSSG